VHYGASEQIWMECCVNLRNSLHNSAQTWLMLMPPWRLFDPDIRPDDIRPKQRRARNAWFRPGVCLRLIYDELRNVSTTLIQPGSAFRLGSVTAAVSFGVSELVSIEVFALRA